MVRINKQSHSTTELLLAMSREELNRIDFKLSILIATEVGLAAFLLTNGMFVPSNMGKIAWVLFALGSIAFMVSFFTLISSIYPITKKKAKDRLIPSYYDEILEFSEVMLQKNFSRITKNQHLNMTIAQLFAISKIVKKKYKLLKISLITLSASIVLLLFYVLAMTLSWF